MLNLKKFHVWLLLSIGISLVYCGKNTDLPVRDKLKDELVIVQASDALDLDPHMQNETVTLSVNGNMFEPLVSLDKDLQIDPGTSLATSWVNPDDSTWIFYLREGVKFHNGDELKARDVKFSLERAKNHPRSRMKGNVALIESVEVIGDYQVKIKTKQPCGILPYKIMDVFILPEKYVKEKGDHWVSTHPVGTGPFRFVEWKKGEYVKMEAFDEYWRGKPTVEDLIFRAISDNNQRLKVLLNGEADIVVDVPVEMVEKVKENRDVKLITRNSLRVIFLAFDTIRDKTPFVDLNRNPLKDLRVRKAIYYGIDENRIITEIMKGFAIPASQFTSPYVFGYNPEIKRLPYDPEKARQLLREAGYGKGFAITLHSPNNRYINDEEIARAVVEDLNRIGIRASLQAMPKEEFFPRRNNAEFSFYLAGWDCPSGEASSVFEDVLHTRDPKSGLGTANPGYSNKELDIIIEGISNEIDPDKRLNRMQLAQKIGMDDVAWVPLHCQMDLYGVSNQVLFTARLDKRIKAYEVKINR